MWNDASLLSWKKMREYNVNRAVFIQIWWRKVIMRVSKLQAAIYERNRRVQNGKLSVVTSDYLRKATSDVARALLGLVASIFEIV